MDRMIVLNVSREMYKLLLFLGRITRVCYDVYSNKDTKALILSTCIYRNGVLVRLSRRLEQVFF